MENYENIYLPWPDWKIIKHLGGGAYGKVYEVYEIERMIPGIQEKAALKIISIPEESELEEDYQNGFDEELIVTKYTKILQEYVNVYKLMKELQGQSNIVRCDDFTVIPHENGIGGEIFIRMELLPSLQQVLRERTLSVEEIIKLGKDISQALIWCESKNIIHRDIKPANIMVSQFGDFKLGNFSDSEVHITQAMLILDEGYIAPEVLGGKEGDIYSLGIVMYWLLNNRRMPFIDADEQLTPRKRQEAKDRRYRGERLPAPKNGGERLKQIVLKACAYRPEGRYASAQEMYEAFVEVENGKPLAPSTIEWREELLVSEEYWAKEEAERLLEKIRVEPNSVIGNILINGWKKIKRKFRI